MSGTSGEAYQDCFPVPVGLQETSTLVYLVRAHR